MISSIFTPEFSELDSIIQKPINGVEIKRWFKYRKEPIILMYDQLARYPNIDMLLCENDAAFILLKSTMSWGHWMCIKRVMDPETGEPIHRTPEDRGIISFFDSYGKFPDSQKTRLGIKFLAVSGQSEDHILRLFRDAIRKGYSLEYSEYPLQLSHPQVATCGRWCALFVLHKSFNVDEFSAYIKDLGERLGLQPDYVCATLYKELDPDK